MRKKLVFIVMLLAASAARAFDFSATATTGQEMYYNIVGSAAVAVVNPGWDYYTPPTGFLSLPATVEHEGITYQVTAIDALAFRSCDGLTGVVVPEGVTSIGRMAFAFCTALDSIVLPTTLTEIGSTAFTGTAYFGDGSHLTAEGLLFIGPYLVASRPSIDSAIIIPEGTLGLGNMAFYSCQLPLVTLPASLRFIGENAFGGCPALDTVTLRATTPPALAYNSFQGVTGVVIAVPCGSGDHYQAAEYWNTMTLVELCDTTGIEDSEEATPTVVAVEGGLLVNQPEGQHCTVYDMQGHTVATLQNSGFVPLTHTGVYLVKNPLMGKARKVVFTK